MTVIINSMETEQVWSCTMDGQDVNVENVVVDFTIPKYDHELFELNGQITLEYSMVKDWTLEEITVYIHNLVVEKAETLGVIPFPE